MRELNLVEKKSVAGAGDPLTDSNSEIIRQIRIASFIGAMQGISTGLPGMALGAAKGAAGAVVALTIAKMPVNVQMPRVPMGPTWNGSRR